MTHLLLLPVASAFLATPCASGDRGSHRDERDSLPVSFLIFCAACAALSVVEVLWPPADAAVFSVETVMVSQL